MQHQIKRDAHGPRTDAMIDAVQSCVHCGFCLAACPTYHLLGEEMDSPRGRIYLMKGVLEGAIEAEAAAPYIDRCLGCQACEPACPSGVAYGDLLMGYRSLTEKTRQRSLIDMAQRRLIDATLPYPKRFQLAVKSGRIAQSMPAIVPQALRPMLALLPASLPEQPTLPALTPAIGPTRGRVALLTGCVQRVLAPSINEATITVLAANGIEVVVPDGQGCCGSLMSHAGSDRRALSLARHNLSIFPDDIDAIIVNAAGCGSGIHEYGLLFKGEPDEEKARAFAAKTRDITQFLDELGLVEPAGFPTPIIVAYHDACHLRHAQGIMTAPRRLLNAIPNVIVKELEDEGRCCGSAGTYNLEQPELANQLGELKADAIEATGAECIVSGNIGCLTQIQTHLARRGRPLPVEHTVELLARAYHPA